ncbi:hypothetical protein HCN51_18440 [Nonomuraea sp. FMUSA5-5]|uniref:Uncharacterized protein n=1 Tax=Nonomuraea composti TaxID=2720023 RepID=A0ABX1B4F2_9ACTN|nr:hypothetical protein [Nonomuraea sp. FMUSA5-5]NJP91415.1 hypothetical protein [Nonomuraea sp. FMUSA5-5]
MTRNEQRRLSQRRGEHQDIKEILMRDEHDAPSSRYEERARIARHRAETAGFRAERAHTRVERATQRLTDLTARYLPWFKDGSAGMDPASAPGTDE